MKIVLSICETTRTLCHHKQPCYENLINVFANHDVYVFGDNIGESLSSYIKSHNPTYFENKLRGKTRWILDKLEFCVNNFNDDDTIYMLEDDYLHQSGSDILIDEGLQHSDYVTLYDHPDKYSQHPQKNPEINGLGETTVLFRTNHSHWKYTNSTTLTFGIKKRTLVEDYSVWVHQINNGDPHWMDYPTFVTLRKSKQRKIAVCIPGKSTHLHSPIMYSPFFPIP